MTAILTKPEEGERIHWPQQGHDFCVKISLRERRQLQLDGGRTAADAFALEWTERGTHNGEFVVAGMRIPATGRRLEWTGVSCYKVADGEIRAVRYYIDPAPLMRVLGAA